MIDKQTLRTSFLAQRKELSNLEYQRRCLELQGFFRYWQGTRFVETIHCFLPIVKNKEPDTWPVIDMLMQREKQVVISKSDLITNVLTHYYYESPAQLQENKWGIPEPVDGREAKVQDLDMVLIPLLAFDLSGHRIGYGKGYYDRFLADCRPDVIKVGVSILPPAQTTFDVDPHDIAMDYCITHERVYDFKKDS